MALILSSHLTIMPTDSTALTYLQTATTSIFFTFAVLFAFLRSFCTGASMNTTLNFGLLAAFLMGVSHLVELAGVAPYIATFNGRYGSLIRNAEWITCLPLLMCAFGHVFKIKERVVLTGAGFQALASIALSVASISTSKVSMFICGVVCVLLLVPSLVVLWTMSLQTDSSIEVTQVWEIRLYASACILVYIFYGGFYLTNALGVVTFEWERIVVVCFDLLWVLFLFAIVFGSQLKSEAGSTAAKVTDLEQANAAQKLFLRFVFHEVRVPFHSLLLGLEHLAAQPELSGHQSLLTILMQSAEMMQRTINDVLLLSRLEDRKLQLEVAPFSVSEMTTAVLQTFEPLANEKKVILAFQVDPSFPHLLLGDQHRISEILANLISNGLKFSKQGQVLDVFMNVLGLSLDTCYFQMKVQDEGIGMTTEDQKLLFMPFSQIRPNQNQSGKGSGLGLSIVKHIVELHKGSITVSSEPGKGSTFFVRMKLPIFNSTGRERDHSSSVSEIETYNNPNEIKPYLSEHQSAPRSNLPHQKELSKQKSSILAVQEASHSKLKCNKILPCELLCPEPGEMVVAESPEVLNQTCLPESLGSPKHVWTSPKNSGPPSSKSESSQKSSNRMKVVTFFTQSTVEIVECNRAVLVVDDSAMNRKLTRLILEQQGFTVDEACNGREAVQMAKEKKYWAIFMDNQMPVMSGVEATRHITKASSSVVIGLTGNSLDEDVSEFLHAGARDVLIKPCKREIMLSVLTELENTI